MMQPDLFSQPLEYSRGRTRTGDYATSRAGAKAVQPRAGSQKARLLRAFASGGPDGLPDDEAAFRAGLPATSCYWKRCGELRAAGLITYTGGSKPGRAGVERMLSVITVYGRETLKGMS